MKNILLIFILFLLVFQGILPVNADASNVSAYENATIAAGKKPDFSIDQTFLRVLLKKGEMQKKELTITNTASRGIRIAIDNDLGFLSVEKEIFVERGEKKKVELNFLHNETGIFTGTLAISSGSLAAELPVAAEVESGNMSADIKIDARTNFKDVPAGEALAAQVSVSNFLGKKKEFSINYKILDMQNNKIIEEDAALSVIDRVTFTKSFSLPSYLKEGDYIIAAEVRYENSTGTSSFLFHVTEEKEQITISYLRDYRMYALIFIIAFAVFIFFFMNYRALKNIENLRSPTRIYNIFKKKETVANAETAARKLLKQQEVIKSAFKSGYLSEKSYKIVGKRIEKMLTEVRKRLKRR